MQCHVSRTVHYMQKFALKNTHIMSIYIIPFGISELPNPFYGAADRRLLFSIDYIMKNDIPMFLLNVKYHSVTPSLQYAFVYIFHGRHMGSLTT